MKPPEVSISGAVNLKLNDSPGYSSKRSIAFRLLYSNISMFCCHDFEISDPLPVMQLDVGIEYALIFEPPPFSPACLGVIR